MRIWGPSCFYMFSLKETSHGKSEIFRHWLASQSVHSQTHSANTDRSCTPSWWSCSLSWAANVLSNGLWGLTDRLRSPRAVQARRSESKSIKATGWISAETPHYLLGGTPISSNWFDKCSSIHRMRDKEKDREPHRMTERKFYSGWGLIKTDSCFQWLTATFDSPLHFIHPELKVKWDVF